MKYLSNDKAVEMGYSRDRRVRRRQFRDNAKYLLNAGSFLNPKSVKGTTNYSVAQWHIFQSRLP